MTTDAENETDTGNQSTFEFTSPVDGSDVHATDYRLVLFDTPSSMNTFRESGEAPATDYGMLLFDTSSSMSTTHARLADLLG